MTPQGQILDIQGTCGFRRCGLTPSSHARSGRGCSQTYIDTKNAKAPPRGALGNFHRWVKLLSRKRRRLYTLQPALPRYSPLHTTLSFHRLNVPMDLRNHPALHDSGRTSCRVFSSRASSLRHSTYTRLWGKRSRRHNNSSNRQQSRPNISAVTVVVVALVRSVYLLSYPAAS